MSNIRSVQERWFTIGLLMVGLSMGTAYGQAPAGQKPTGLVLSDALAPQAASDKVVLKVGDEAVTQGDIDGLIKSLNPQAQKALATQGRRPLGEQYALMLVLSQNAVSHHLDATPSFQRTLALQRTQLLAQLAYQELAQQNGVSPEETSKYFAAHSKEFDQVLIRQVVILKKPEGAKEGLGLTAEEAKARADAIRKALSAGEDAKKVAEQFRLPDVIRVDPDPTAVRRGAMRADMDKAAFELKDGQVSQDFDSPQSILFFQVTGHRPADLKDVSSQLENIVRQQKIEGALAELKKNAQIWMDDGYFAASSGASSQGAVKPPVAGSETKQ